MSIFTKIDYERWPRREYYEFFGRTTIYMTVQLNIRPLWDRVKERGEKLYPALLYGAATASTTATISAGSLTV